MKKTCRICSPGWGNVSEKGWGKVSEKLSRYWGNDSEKRQANVKMAGPQSRCDRPDSAAPRSGHAHLTAAYVAANRLATSARGYLTRSCPKALSQFSTW